MAEVWKDDRHSEGIYCLSTDQHGRVASAGSGGVKLWSADGHVAHRITGSVVSSATSVAFFKKRNDAFLVASGVYVLSFDLRNLSAPQAVFTVGDDGEELNDIGISERDIFASVCDDAGVVRVLDLRANRVFKTMRKQHDSVCSSVTFRPHRPWQVVSVGLDCRLVRWDFSRGRPIQVMEFSETCLEQEAKTVAGAKAVMSGTPMVNPPMLHQADFHPRGDWMVLAGGDCSVRLLHGPSRSPLSEVCKWSGVHELSVCQAQFTHFAPDRLVVSGGNDARLVLWNVANYVQGSKVDLATAGSASASHSSPVLRTWEHGSKINWLTTGWEATSGHIYVADQTSNITVYRVDQ